MTRRTQTSTDRHFEYKTSTIHDKYGRQRQVTRLVKRIQVVPASPLLEMRCECGRKHMVSEGQIKKCFHDPYAKSRRKVPKPLKDKE